jgi:hypothetical protein
MRTPARTQSVSADAITIITGHNYDNIGTGIDTYSGVRFAANGDMYAYQTAGGTTYIGTWLGKGTNSDYYLVSTIDSGSLQNDDGRGPLQLNADRDYYCLDTTVSGDPEEAIVTFTIEDVGTTDFAGPTPLSFYAFKTQAG